MGGDDDGVAVGGAVNAAGVRVGRSRQRVGAVGVLNESKAEGESGRRDGGRRQARGDDRVAACLAYGEGGAARAGDARRLASRSA